MRITSLHHIKPLHTDTINSSEVKKADTFFNSHLNDLPSTAKVLAEQKNKPSTFKEDFASLIKVDDLKPKSSITAPFIFLGKMGSSILSKFKTVLKQNKAQFEIDKAVQGAKKHSKKSKSTHKA